MFGVGLPIGSKMKPATLSESTDQQRDKRRLDKAPFMVAFFMPRIGKINLDPIQGGRRNTGLENVDSVVCKDADIVYPAIHSLREQSAHPRPVHFDSQIAVLRVALGHSDERIPHAKSDFYDAGPPTLEQTVPVDTSRAFVQPKFRETLVPAPLLAFGHSPRAHDKAAYTTVEGHRVVCHSSEFLTGLQELPEESFLLCAANDIHSLKPEMLRADRFDKIFFVGLPSHNERKHIFQINLSNIQTDHEYDYDALAQATAFMTGAEIVSLIRETKFYVTSEDFRPITTKDILKYAPLTKNTIWRKHPDTVKGMYQYALEQWDWASTEQMEDAKIILGRTNKTKSKVVLT